LKTYNEEDLKKLKFNILWTFGRVFSILFLMLSCLGCGFLVLRDIFLGNTAESLRTSIGVSIFCFMLSYIFFRFIKSLLKKNPLIAFDDKTIKINRNTIKINDIIDTTFFEKYKYGSVTKGAITESQFREGMKITLANGNEIILFDEFYKNLSELKLKLNQGTLPPNKNLIHAKPEIKQYRNSQFKRIRGYILLAFVIYFGNRIMVFSDNWATVLFFSLLIFWVIIYHSDKMNFFSLSETSLIIKKENIFWFQNSFDLDNIHEVVFDYYTTPPLHWFKIKQLRVIQNNFEQNIYPASLLTKKNWEDLEKELLDRGVTVRNERNIDYT
jgi:hypothetical protein